MSKQNHSIRVVGLFFNAEVRTGGHRRYLDLLAGLAASGIMTTAFFNRSQPFRPEGVHSIELQVPDSSIFPRSVVYRRAIRAFLRSRQSPIVEADWIVVFGESHLSAARLLKKTLAARLLYAHRSNSVREAMVSLDENRQNLLAGLRIRTEILKARAYEYAIERSAEVIVFQSEFDKKDFVSRVPFSAVKALVIRGNIAEPHFAARWSQANKSVRLKKILFLGALNERKGVRYFLDAVRLLRDRGIEGLDFQIIGFGRDEEVYKRMARNLGISDRVEFYGRTNDPLPQLAAADLLIVPSLFDSYPNTILEALHVGTPVIASETGGIPDMLNSSELLFPIRDAAAIADVIEGAIKDASRYERIKKLCSLRRDHFQFDWVGAFVNSMKIREQG